MIKKIYCGKLLTPFKQLKGCLLHIEQGRIGKLEQKLRPLVSFQATGFLDCSTYIVAPGFIDLQIQGCGGFGFLDGTPASIKGILATAAQGGCTSLLATITISRKDRGLKRFARIVKEIRAAKRRIKTGARIIGIHLEGPYINPAKRGGFGSPYVKKPDAVEFRKLLSIATGLVKLVTIAPELPGAREIMAEALRHNIKVSLGHTTATYEEAQQAFAQGADQVTHFFNAMREFHHREPGLVGAALERGGIYLQIIPDGVHVSPAVLKILARLKSAADLILITDATAPCGLPDGQEFPGVGGRIKKIDGAIRLPDGTLAGSALLMDEAVRKMYEFSRQPLGKVIEMVSATPARAIGIFKEVGEIALGKLADFAVLDDSLRIVYTIKQGRVIYRADFI